MTVTNIIETETSGTSQGVSCKTYQQIFENTVRITISDKKKMLVSGQEINNLVWNENICSQEREKTEYFPTQEIEVFNFGLNGVVEKDTYTDKHKWSSVNYIEDTGRVLDYEVDLFSAVLTDIEKMNGVIDTFNSIAEATHGLIEIENMKGAKGGISYAERNKKYFEISNAIEESESLQFYSDNSEMDTLSISKSAQIDIQEESTRTFIESSQIEINRESVDDESIQQVIFCERVENLLRQGSSGQITNAQSFGYTDSIAFIGLKK